MTDEIWIVCIYANSKIIDKSWEFVKLINSHTNHDNVFIRDHSYWRIKCDSEFAFNLVKNHSDVFFTKKE